MTDNHEETEYGSDSPDYGLSYEPDPWADPEPDDRDPYARESDADLIESHWEHALREGYVTREQFAQRRRRQ